MFCLHRRTSGVRSKKGVVSRGASEQRKGRTSGCGGKGGWVEACVSARMEQCIRVVLMCVFISHVGFVCLTHFVIVGCATPSSKNRKNSSPCPQMKFHLEC